jgi:hypothetical protein
VATGDDSVAVELAAAAAAAIVILCSSRASVYEKSEVCFIRGNQGDNATNKD